MLEKSNHSNTKENFQQIITGIWKFKEEIPTSELEAVAKEWAKDPKFMQLYIRKVSKDQYGIGFMYDNRGSKDGEATYDAFYEKGTDELKRKFGNGFYGWDLSSTTNLVK
jgi:hypothetical protein